MSAWDLTSSQQFSDDSPGRKIQCDEGVPNCRRCVQARRECEGYGLRLSWPRENDKKRAIVAVLPVISAPMRTRHMSCSPFLNTTSQDIELYCRLSSRGAPKTLSSGLPSLKLWSQPRSEATDMELIHYCKHTSERFEIIDSELI